MTVSRLELMKTNLAAYERREQRTLDAAMFLCGSSYLPRTEVRNQIRKWFWTWRIGIMAEIEKEKRK